METLPSYAKLAEVQLGIVYPDETKRSAANLKLPTAPMHREVWGGQIAFSNLIWESAHKLLAWFEQFDGRKGYFGFPMVAGHQTKSDTHTATLASATTSGASSLSLTVSPVSGTIAAGTLITLGSADSDEYQVFEVLADTKITANPVSVEISPRVRWVFSAGSSITFGATNLRLRLNSDKLADHSLTLTHGVLTVDVIEAVAVTSVSDVAYSSALADEYVEGA